MPRDWGMLLFQICQATSLEFALEGPTLQKETAWGGTRLSDLLSNLPHLLMKEKKVTYNKWEIRWREMLFSRVQKSYFGMTTTDI